MSDNGYPESMLYILLLNLNVPEGNLQMEGNSLGVASCRLSVQEARFSPRW